MNLFIVLISFMILSFAVAFLSVKKKYLIYIIMALVLFGGVLGVTGFNYFTNHQFRLAIDLKFRHVTQHEHLSDKNIPPLPLPNSTAFSYRYSDEGATYCTTLDKEQITNYFKRISDKGTYVKDLFSIDEKEKFKFNYKNIPFSVSIERSSNPKRNYIYIDSNKN